MVKPGRQGIVVETGDRPFSLLGMVGRAPPRLCPGNLNQRMLSACYPSTSSAPLHSLAPSAPRHSSGHPQARSLEKPSHSQAPSRKQPLGASPGCPMPSPPSCSSGTFLGPFPSSLPFWGQSPPHASGSWVASILALPQPQPSSPALGGSQPHLGGALGAGQVNHEQAALPHLLQDVPDPAALAHGHLEHSV